MSNDFTTASPADSAGSTSTVDDLLETYYFRPPVQSSRMPAPAFARPQALASRTSLESSNADSFVTARDGSSLRSVPQSLEELVDGYGSTPGGDSEVLEATTGTAAASPLPPPLGRSPYGYGSSYGTTRGNPSTSRATGAPRLAHASTRTSSLPTTGTTPAMPGQTSVPLHSKTTSAPTEGGRHSPPPASPKRHSVPDPLLNNEYMHLILQMADELEVDATLVDGKRLSDVSIDKPETSTTRILPPATRSVESLRRRTPHAALQRLNSRVVGAPTLAAEARAALAADARSRAGDAPAVPAAPAGRTLGLFGPRSRIRRATTYLLRSPVTEPLILVLILASAILLTLQAAPNVYTSPRPQTGFFHTYEDYALFVIFIVFTVEMFARIVVSGLIVNPGERWSVWWTRGWRSNRREDSGTTYFGSGSTGSAGSTRKIWGDLFHKKGSARTKYPPGASAPVTPPDDTPTFSRVASDRSGEIRSTSDRRISAIDMADEDHRPYSSGYAGYNDNHPSARAPSYNHALASTFDEKDKGSVSSVYLGSPEHAEIRAVRNEDEDEPTLYVSPAAPIDAEQTLRHMPSFDEPASDGFAAPLLIPKVITNLTPFMESLQLQRRTYRHAYLRHSWNRIDCIAVLSFWIMFALAVTDNEYRHNVYIFRSLSVLRISRLLAITSGTSTILRSLKLAAPNLARVAIFITFAMCLFSIIGVQSFKDSYRRHCVWIDPSGVRSNVTLDQFCGGYTIASGERLSYLNEEHRQYYGEPKGYICQYPSVCQEADNPVNGVYNFDNIFSSLLQVVITSSANTWSGFMYNMMDADYFFSCAFFIICVIVLNFWLINMFVAVITGTFGSIMDETKQSAFMSVRRSASRVKAFIEDREDPDEEQTSNVHYTRPRLRRAYLRYAETFWVTVITSDFIAQSIKDNLISHPGHTHYDVIEIVVTIALDFEIALRLFVVLPQWRRFFHHNRNNTDTFLAVMSSIILIPPIRDCSFFPWLTIFQAARFYRAVLFIPRMRLLVIRVLGTIWGLINTVFFIVIMTFLAALFALQMFRGIPQLDDPDVTQLNFYQSFNGFLSMYQILSSENWTDVLNNVLDSQRGQVQIVITALFLSAWMYFAFFILMNMFIAVINENFAVAENLKRKKQIEAYIEKNKPAIAETHWFQRFNPYNYLHSWRVNKQKGKGPVSGPARDDSGGIELNTSISGTLWSDTETPKKADAQARAHAEQMSAYAQLDFGDEYKLGGSEMHDMKRSAEIYDIKSRAEGADVETHSVEVTSREASDVRASRETRGTGHTRTDTPHTHDIKVDSKKLYHEFKSKIRGAWMKELKESGVAITDEELLEHDNGGSTIPVLPLPNRTDHIKNVMNERREYQVQFIREHPTYDYSLFVFTQRNPVRRLCQRLVKPCYGDERINGTPPSKWLSRAFLLLVYGTIVASVVVSAIATPSYRRDFYEDETPRLSSWFSVGEIVFGLVIVLEFIVKVIADGFVFAPNAYMLSVWTSLDFFVLLTQVVNISFMLSDPTGASRFVRALKAFRALRLLSMAAPIRQTFYSLIIGMIRVLDASLLAFLYMLPFAYWGHQIFAAQLRQCNDTSPGILYKAHCAGEYMAAVVDDWEYLTPRAWRNPYVWSFDSLRSSILILFEIISLEGWIDVMVSVMNISGFERQAETNHSQWNAVFFLIYNLLGAAIVLTIFVSVIIEDFTKRSGTALLSKEQKRWRDIKKMIKRLRPAKRPSERPAGASRAWCFDRAVDKRGWWSKSMTLLYLCFIITMMTQASQNARVADEIRNYIFLALSIVYLIDIFIRVYGLGMHAFLTNGWNWYDIATVIGTFATTITLCFLKHDHTALQMQKLFLVMIAFKLVQKNDSLNQLFKAAVASLPSIANIACIWIILFVVWAIFYIEIFGLTRWGVHGTNNKNYTTFAKAMVMLMTQSTGEGWNGFMHDYTLGWPDCTESDNYLLSDCGSSGWSYTLFITWNVLSQYLMQNLILAAVIENFSHVFNLRGKEHLMDRKAVRGFKDTWARFDRRRSGYLPRTSIIPFLKALPGVFELNVYPAGYSIAETTAMALQLDAQKMRPSTEYRGRLVPTAASLNEVLSRLDYREIRRRRIQLNRIYHEALADVVEPKGISFTNMLSLLVHHLIVDDDRALTIEELVERKGKVARMIETLNGDKVHGFVQMNKLRKDFLRYRASHTTHASGETQNDTQWRRETHASVVSTAVPTAARTDVLSMSTSGSTVASSPPGSHYNIPQILVDHPGNSPDSIPNPNRPGRS